MEGEDDRLVPGDELVEVPIGKPVGMLGLGLQCHEVDRVDHPDLQLGWVGPQNGDRGQRLQCWHVTRAGHHHVGRAPLVVAGPLPDTDPLGEVLSGGSTLEAFTCWAASSSGLTSFDFPFDQIARGAVQTPTSVGVVEALYNTNGVSDGSAWYQPLNCAP
jgi:hypothetical protein